MRLNSQTTAYNEVLKLKRPRLINCIYSNQVAESWTLNLSVKSTKKAIRLDWWAMKLKKKIRKDSPSNVSLMHLRCLQPFSKIEGNCGHLHVDEWEESSWISELWNFSLFIPLSNTVCVQWAPSYCWHTRCTYICLGSAVKIEWQAQTSNNFNNRQK